MGNPYLRFRGATVSASYNEQPLERWRGNPFLEALPPVVEDTNQVFDFLMVLPPFDETTRKLGSELRLHLLPDLKRFLMPTEDTHLNMFRAISVILRAGYELRNPVGKPYVRYLTGIDNSQPESAPGEFCWDPPSGQSIFGLSGTGKTQGMQRVLSYYPQVIVHTQYHDRPFTQAQLVWLKLDCPKDRRVKALCLSFFQSVDTLLRTDYYHEYGGNGRSSSTVLISGMQKVAKLIGLGLLVIDETQLLYEINNTQDKDLAQKLIDALVQLENDIGCPLVLIGSPLAQYALNDELAIARRASNVPDIFVDPLSEETIDWENYSTALWDYQFLRTYCPLTDDLRHTLFDESLGIPGVAAAIYTGAQYRAITSGTEKIDPSMLRRIIREDYPRLVGPLEKLRRGQVEDIRDYEDMYFMSLIDDGKTGSAPAADTANSLKSASPKYHRSRGGSKRSGPRKTRGSSANPHVSKRKLTMILEQTHGSDVDPYDAIKQAGYICDLNEFTL